MKFVGGFPLPNPLISVTAIVLPVASVIVSCVPGAGEQTVDVSDAVRRALVRGQLRLTVSNALAGSDPAPNMPKELVVTYEHRGQRSVRRGGEGQEIVLP